MENSTEAKAEEVGKDADLSATAMYDVLGPSDDPLKLSDGRTVNVSPMRMKQIRRFIDVSQKFLGPLSQSVQDNGEIDLQAIASLDQDAFVHAVGIAANMTVEELDDLYPDDFALIVGKVLVVNMDFFALRLPTTLMKVKVAVGSSFANTLKKIQQANSRTASRS